MNLNLMTVSELRKLAVEFGIAGRSTMKKAELIAALSADEFASILELKAGIAESEAEEREMNEIRAEIAAESTDVEAVDADKVVPAGMFDPELTYYADGTHVVMRAQGAEQHGVTIGMTTNASPYQFQAVRFADGTVKNVAPHVLHRDDVAEQAAYIEEGIEIDERASQADAEAGELLDAVLGEYVEPIANNGQIAITKYSANEAIATAVLGVDSVGGSVTRERGRWVLRAEGRTVRAKTLGKVAKLWAKALGFHATAIDIETMS